MLYIEDKFQVSKDTQKSDQFQSSCNTHQIEKTIRFFLKRTGYDKGEERKSHPAGNTAFMRRKCNVSFNTQRHFIFLRIQSVFRDTTPHQPLLITLHLLTYLMCSTGYHQVPAPAFAQISTAFHWN